MMVLCTAALLVGQSVPFLPQGNQDLEEQARERERDWLGGLMLRELSGLNFTEEKESS